MMTTFQYSSLAFAVVMLLTRNDCLSFYFCCPGSFFMLLSTTKALLKHYFKAFHFESFSRPGLRTYPCRHRELEVLWGLAHCFRQNHLANGEVTPLGQGTDIKERDRGKMVATTSFSSKSNKVNTIHL